MQLKIISAFIWRNDCRTASTAKHFKNFAILWTLESSYLGWDYSDSETAVLGVAFHSFEWLFVRVAPIILIGAITGIFLIRKRE